MAEENLSGENTVLESYHTIKMHHTLAISFKVGGFYTPEDERPVHLRIWAPWNFGTSYIPIHHFIFKALC